MTRNEIVTNALQEIQGLWPSTVRNEEIRKRVVGKLQLAFSRGRFQEIVTSLLETEPRRPENIINAITKHIGIVHGYDKREEEKQKDFALNEIDWEKHRQSDCAKMFQRICKCQKDTGRIRKDSSSKRGHSPVMEVDKEKLLDCYEEMLADPNKYKMSEIQETELEQWVQERRPSYKQGVGDHAED